MKSNLKSLRRKALYRKQILSLFRKIYWVYVTLFVLTYIGCLIPPHLEVFPVSVICVIFLAGVTFVAQIVYEEEIENGKPLTKTERKRVVFVLDVIKETSYFEVQYLTPGTKRCDA